MKTFKRLSLDLIIFLLPFSLLSQNTDNIFFSDFHNSFLNRVFDENNCTCLEDNRWPVNLNSLKSSKTKILVASLCVPRFNLSFKDTVTIHHVIKFFKYFKNHCINQENDLLFVDDLNVLKSPSKEKKLIIFSLEGTHLLKGCIDWIDSLSFVGVRIIGIGHHFENEFLNHLNSSKYDRAPTFLSENTALTQLGRKLIERMISRGILIDVSHLPESVFWQIFKINSNRSPLVASHSNVKVLCDTSRNLSDDQIRAIAESGGIIGICFHTPFLSENRDSSNVADIINHIEYIVNLVGDDYVAIGTDLEGKIRPPNNLYILNDISLLIKEMEKRNFSKTSINKIMWENILRLFLHSFNYN